MGSWGGDELPLAGFSFIGGVAFGVLLASTSAQNPRQAAEYLSWFYGKADDGQFQTGLLGIWAIIFFRNTLVSAVAGTLGILHRSLPALIAALNGAVVGGVASLLVKLGVSVDLVLALLLPHGMVEVPALIGACALGIRLTRVAEAPGVMSRLVELARSWRAFLVIALLLAIAAVIEATLIHLMN